MEKLFNWRIVRHPRGYYIHNGSRGINSYLCQDGEVYPWARNSMRDSEYRTDVYFPTRKEAEIALHKYENNSPIYIGGE